MNRRLVRRTSAARRTPVPRVRETNEWFGSMFMKLAGAGERLERSRRPMRKR